jgi:plasmid stabilization system protein ParE
LAVEKQAPVNAARWLERVYAAAEALESFPRRGGLAPENEFRPYEIRKLNVGDHVLLYTIDEPSQTVWVLGLRHGARLPQATGLPPGPTSGETHPLDTNGT